MTSKNVLFVGALCLSAFFNVGGLAQPPASIPTMDTEMTDLGGNNSIAGTVVMSDGTAIQRRVSVRLMTATRGERIAFTDEHGKFLFRGLPSGDYTLAIDREKEYETASQSVTIIQARGMPSQTYLVNLRLVAKREGTAKPGVVNAALANVPPKALAAYKKAGELASQGKRTEAIEQLQAAIAAYPNFAQAYNDLGIQYLKTGDLVKADEAFVKSIQIDPGYYNGTLNHGIVVFTVRQYKDAEPILRKAVAIKDDSAPAHYFLGQTLANLNSFDEAERELTKALKLNAGEVKEAYRILAIIHDTKGSKDQAATDLETYLKLNPKAADADQLKDRIKKYHGQAKP